MATLENELKPVPTPISPITENNGEPLKQRYTGIKAYKFTFHFEEVNFSFVPINFYYVKPTHKNDFSTLLELDKNGKPIYRPHSPGVPEHRPPSTIAETDFTNPYLVFIYQITIRDNSGNESTAIIPYYISDGHTNNLRANLIFPFVCFNDIRNGEDCPWSRENTFGMLYKHTPARNLVLKLNPPEGYPIDKDRNETIGLSSVLPRITNLLDFIICIGSSEFIKENIIETDLYNFRPVTGYSILDKYDMNMISILPEEPTYKTYRKNILEYLAQYRNKLEDSGIKLEPCYVIINQTDIRLFNRKYRVCGKEPEAETNYRNYVNISKSFFKSFKRSLSQDNIFNGILSTNPVYSKLHILDHIYNTFFGVCRSDRRTRMDIYETEPTDDIQSEEGKPPAPSIEPPPIPVGPPQPEEDKPPAPSIGPPQPEEDKPPALSGQPIHPLLPLSVGKPPSLPAGPPPSLPAGPPPLPAGPPPLPAGPPPSLPAGPPPLQVGLLSFEPIKRKNEERSQKKKMII